ncbi:MAG: tRNA preQ1(34) S-adenosylmethionine ribosyltransferase-isomerase QueA [Maricaulis sp.]|nr:tRNA preQ1(34) S-adenosylmethionine ribosyltransferase-isomerase QueA [Maricaulis sp.]
MRLSDFDYDLPDERIALRPARPRDSARLLHIRADGSLGDHGVKDLASLLRPGDLLVSNDTHVLRAALTGERAARAVGGGGAAKISVNLHTRDNARCWRAFVKPAKRLKVGDEIRFGSLKASIEAKRPGGEVVLEFDCEGEALDRAIAIAGQPPLPPYIASKRAPDAQDADDYQTVFADPDKTGSVAAPTAGLHFTDDLMAALRRAGVEFTAVTLHVGAGTFLPVKSENIAEHQMHSEWYEVSEAAAETINRARADGRRIIPVGTTALRTLESAASEDGELEACVGETEIFITPGYRFRAADALLTNFHLPKSTLLMLVSAMAGTDVIKRAYAHAVKVEYRFFSYGDACLIERADR